MSKRSKLKKQEEERKQLEWWTNRPRRVLIVSVPSKWRQLMRSR